MRIPLKINKAINFNDSNIIIKIARVKLRMNVNAETIHLNIWVELAVIVNIPLSQPDPQLFWSVLLDTMRCCQDMGGIYQGSSTNINIVILLFLQYGHLPGIFSWKDGCYLLFYLKMIFFLPNSVSPSLYTCAGLLILPLTPWAFLLPHCPNVLNCCSDTNWLSC